MKRISLIQAPLVSEQYFSGVSLMPEALLKVGLKESLNAELTTILPLPDWKSVRDPETKILNPKEVHDYSINLADAVEKDLQANFFPIVVGGDCTILLGSLLALKRKTNPALFFIDGHADFYAPGISPSGETADMELGFVIGRGPDILSNLENKKPLASETDTVLFGFRDEELIKQTGGENVRDTNIHCVSLEDTRYYGFSNAVEKSLECLSSKESIWIHLDLDVLDDSIMPAVDYRMKDGLSVGEVVSTLQRIIKTGKAVGMSVTIFNPTLDFDQVLAKKIVELLKAGLIF